LAVLGEVCDNEHNKEACQRLKATPLLLECTLLALGESSQESVYQLLSLLTEHASGRAALAESPAAVWAAIRQGLDIAGSQSKEADACMFALSFFSNCAYDKNFRVFLRAQSPAAHTHLSSYLSSRKMVLQSRAWGVLGNLLTDTGIRREFVTESVPMVVDALVRCAAAFRKAEGGDLQATVFIKVLAVVANCSVESDAMGTEIYQRETAQKLLGDLIFIAFNPKASPTVRERCVAVLARCCKTASARDVVTSQGGVEAMLAILAEPVSTAPKKLATVEEDDVLTEVAHEHATRGLALLTSDCDKASSKVVKYTTKGGVTAFALLIKLLSSSNKQILGNAALCVSSCAKNKDVLPLFREAIPPLIELMKKGDASVAQNASIATARLAQDPANLQIIRDLRGIEIMGAVNRNSVKR
jgi:hypothetical protein